MSALYEMGWNDVAGNLRAATAMSLEQKRSFALQLLLGKIILPRSDSAYVDGVTVAATIFLLGEPLEFKGPQWVRDDLGRKVNQPPTPATTG